MDRSIKNIQISPFACAVIAVSILTIPMKWVLAWLGAVAIHEAGHLLALVLCGVRIYDFQINLNGAKIVTEQMQGQQTLITTLAGPLIGAVPILFARLNPHLAVCSALLTLYNIMPLYPLDGGRVLYCVVSFLFQNSLGVKIYKIISRLFLISLTIACVVVSNKFDLGCILPAFCLILIVRYWNGNPSCKERELIVQ